MAGGEGARGPAGSVMREAGGGRWHAGLTGEMITWLTGRSRAGPAGRVVRVGLRGEVAREPQAGAGDAARLEAVRRRLMAGSLMGQRTRRECWRGVLPGERRSPVKLSTGACGLPAARPRSRPVHQIRPSR